MLLEYQRSFFWRQVVTPSPLDSQHSDAVRNYGDSWRAIMHLVRSGYSWSGNERNCVLLNCTPPQSNSQLPPPFANVSAVSGLDFPDDGRGLAVVDWDHDGDLDLWLRNRTAPRLRLMRNLTSEMATDEQSIMLRLIGTRCNRDAIGARAELVVMSADGNEQRLVRSVRAGDAFLSQSSSWLHFGIPQETAAQQLVVIWPGGIRETIAEVAPGGRYEIKQGSGQASLLTPRAPVHLAAEPYEPLPPTAAARIVLPGRIPLPRLELQSDDQVAELRVSAPATLVLFWTSSCPNCQQELADIAQHRAEFERANLDVVAVCLDGLDDPGGSAETDFADANLFVQQVNFPFQVASTSAASMERLRVFQNLLFSKYPSFVVPFSLLLDSEGNVISIYRGAFPHETLVLDRKLADLDDESLRMLAVPLMGTWITKPATRSQFAEFVGARMIAHDPGTALRYYQAALATEQDVERHAILQQQVDSLKRSSESKAGS